jgi:hypothetical protein
MEERITASSDFNSQRWIYWVTQKCSYQHTTLHGFFDAQLGFVGLQLISKGCRWGNLSFYVWYCTIVLSTACRPRGSPQGEAKKNQRGHWEDMLSRHTFPVLHTNMDDETADVRVSRPRFEPREFRILRRVLQFRLQSTANTSSFRS